MKRRKLNILRNILKIDIYTEKNNFAKISKNLARYRSENNFVYKTIIKLLCRKVKYDK